MATFAQLLSYILLPLQIGLVILARLWSEIFGAEPVALPGMGQPTGAKA